DPPNGLEEADELFSFAAPRQGDDDVAGLDDTEVAVNRFGRVEEDGGRTGAGERRGDLSGDDSRLAHAGRDDMADAVLEKVDSSDEIVVKLGNQPNDRICLCL